MKTLNLLNEMPIGVHLEAVDDAPPPTPRCFPRLPAATHRRHSVLLDLLVVGDDLPDAVDKAALIVGDEAHEYLLFGGVEQHQHSHLAGRRRVGEVHAAGLEGGSKVTQIPRGGICKG